MWRDLSREDFLAVLKALEEERYHIETGIVKFKDDEYFTAHEKKRIELDDVQNEIAVTSALIHGNRLAQSAEWILSPRPGMLFLYPETDDINTLKRLLLIFDEVAIILPFIKTEELEPELVEIDRKIATSIWAPQDDQLVHDIEILNNAGLIKIIEPEKETKELKKLFTDLYSRSIRSKIQKLEHLEQVEYVNSDSFECEIRLLECTTVASFFGGVAISDNSDLYTRTLSLQREAWGGTEPKDLGIISQKPADYIEVYAGLNVLSKSGGVEQLSIDELMNVRALPDRTELISHLHSLSGGVALAESDREFNEIASELAREVSQGQEKLGPPAARTKLAEYAIPVVGTVLSLASGGAVGVLSTAIGSAAVEFSEKMKRSRLRTREVDVTFEGFIHNIENLKFAKTRDRIITASNYLLDLE